MIAKANKPDFSKYVPSGIDINAIEQDLIPKIAKDENLITKIRENIKQIETNHRFHRGDSTSIDYLNKNSIHLVVTSPPYWTLKEYEHTAGQLGDVVDYDNFNKLLESVWEKCYEALVPGGRLVCVVGDVCLSRKKNGGRHTVVPLHATIQESCRKIGYDNISPIIWHKISNAKFEAAGNSTFLGKPYEPNSVIKNDIEFILMERKHGGYRSPTASERILSVISEVEHKQWFQQIWSGVTGASTRNHPAPYPIELANRLIRMFSFVGDTVFDPFHGSGTTAIAAMLSGRNSITSELETSYLRMAVDRFEKESKLTGTKHTYEIVDHK